MTEAYSRLADGDYRKTDFFLIGGSNSGTTAMSLWLRAHPQVCFSTPKGPGYFSDDFENYRYVKCHESYEACFEDSGPPNRLRGEGSTWYLYSDRAVPNIMDYNPDAKFIVILRNPLDHVRSFYNTLFHQANEDLAPFEAAWRAQEARRAGNKIPESCMEPKFLQYGKMSAFGWQIERLFNWVDRCRVLVLLYEDHVTRPKETYGATLSFLGLEPDGRSEFPVAIPHIRPRSWLVNRYALRPSRFRSAAGDAIRRALGINSLGVTNLLRRLNNTTHKRAQSSQTTHDMLIAHFGDDIIKLGRLLDRDLSHWLERSDSDQVAASG